jgi:hypothetical protein
MTNPPEKESGTEHNSRQNPDNKEKLKILVQTLIDNLISDRSFANLLGLDSDSNSDSREFLINKLLTNLDIVIYDELVCQDV